jgi:hypothetical protein
VLPPIDQRLARQIAGGEQGETEDLWPSFTPQPEKEGKLSFHCPGEPDRRQSDAVPAILMPSVTGLSEKRSGVIFAIGRHLHSKSHDLYLVLFSAFFVVVLPGLRLAPGRSVRQWLRVSGAFGFTPPGSPFTCWF